MFPITKRRRIRGVQWSRGIDFVSAAREVAGYLGIDATDGGNSDSPSSCRKQPPDKHLSWRPWNDTIARLWCRHKPGVTIDGIRAAGGRLARYRGQYTVIAFPVWGPLLDKANPVGWVIVNTTGKALPKFSAAGEVDWITRRRRMGGRRHPRRPRTIQAILRRLEARRNLRPTRLAVHA